jgi:hypothetical protein
MIKNTYFGTDFGFIFVVNINTFKKVEQKKKTFSFYQFRRHNTDDLISNTELDLVLFLL